MGNCSAREQLEYKKLLLLCDLGMLEALLKTRPEFGADPRDEGTSPLEANLQSMKISLSDIDNALFALEEPSKDIHD